MPTIFTRIIQRELPAHIIAEDEQHIAFLDIHPLTRGHTLVVPKREAAALFHLPTEAFTALMLFTKQVASTLQKALGCERIVMHVAGFQVPHVHVHLIPASSEPKLTMPSAIQEAGDLTSLAKALYEAFRPEKEG